MIAISQVHHFTIYIFHQFTNSRLVTDKLSKFNKQKKFLALHI
jgi:hypothetical protein